MSLVPWLLSAPLVCYVLWHGISVILSLRERRFVSQENSVLGEQPRVAFLYVTCDDFVPAACQTLLAQSNVRGDLFILDDSRDANMRKVVDQWVDESGHAVQVVRRHSREGYKGGNVNYWLATYGDPSRYPYALLVDADEHVPPNFCFQLLQILHKTNLAFVQACHIGTARLQTAFQHLLHIQVECEWFYHIPSRNFSGCPPMLGHGILIQTELLRKVGGFPNVVSEDLGLTILLAERQHFGRIVPSVVGLEEFPGTYRAYWRRRRRWVQADTEILLKMLLRLWTSKCSLLAKLDLTLRELRLPLASSCWIALLGWFVIARDREAVVEIPSIVWLSMVGVLAPALPSLLCSRLSIAKRILYILTMPFVGTAGIATYPVAVGAALLGRRQFRPTGSTTTRTGWHDSFLSLWEMVAGGTLLAAGCLGGNSCAVALGIAVSASPLMRTHFEILVLYLGTAAFWSLIALQILLDVVGGGAEISHLLVLLGFVVVLL